MFLKNNKLEWKKILIAGLITVILCITGVLFFDKPVYLFLRNFDWSGWVFIDKIFDSKIWLLLFGIISAVIFIKNIIKSKYNFKKNIKQFNLKVVFNKIKEISKHNYAFLVFCSVFVSGVISAVLKFGFGRQRPIFYEALDQTGFYPFTHEWAFNSMPSGHTAASFAGLVMIGLLFPKFKWVTWTLAIIIGASRICHGLHFPSDIILGAFIGMFTADLVKSLFYKK